MDLMPYLLAMKNSEQRKKFTENARNGEFDINLLKVGHVFRIRGPNFSKVDYFECEVKYIGETKNGDAGHYILLQIKNEHTKLSNDQKQFLFHKFKGAEFIVTAYWIMENLYKGESSSDEHESSAIDDIPTNHVNYESNDPVPTPPIDQSIASSKTTQPNIIRDIELLSNADGTVKNTQEIKCDLCNQLVEINQGIILRECLHSFCCQCIRTHVARNTRNTGIQCPYNKEYICRTDILDIEIKDLGGEGVYNIILENRLKHFISIVPNARQCPNADCDNLWINTCQSYFNFERCQKCFTRWCYICDAAHEVGERHVRAPITHVAASCKNLVIEAGVDRRETSHEEEVINRESLVTSQTQPSAGIIIKDTKTTFSEADRKSSKSIDDIKICEPNDALKTEPSSSETSTSDKILTYQLKGCGGYKTLKICPNRDCRFAWIPPTPKPNVTFEQCPKCNTNWCYLCEMGHEPNERHSSKSREMISTKLPEVLTNVGQSVIGSEDIMKEATNIVTSRAPETLSNKTSHYFDQEALAAAGLKPTKVNKTGTIPKIIPHHTYNRALDSEELVKTTSSTKPLSHIAEIELLDNSHGLVKNPERTKCELCFRTVEIGHGVILRECLHTFCRLCIITTISIKNNFGIRCPYKQDYECQFDLLDIEIKDLSDYAYSRILDNRLNNFLVNGTNAKKSRSEERQSGEFNGNSLGARLSETFLDAVPAHTTTTCAKCHKSNILTKDSFTLRGCSHIFCNECIRSMIYTQTSGSKYAQCTICNDRIKDIEVIKIAGNEVLKLFLENRIKPDNTPSTEFCCCQPQTPNCGVILRCKHRICKQALTRILKEQLKRSSRVVCPLCLEELDDDLIQVLIKETEKCRMCSKQADMNLEQCRHWFCSTCFHKFILEQMLEPNTVSVNCIACHISVTNSDISQYASEEILKFFKSKLEEAKLPAKRVEQIETHKGTEKYTAESQNDKISVTCITCDKKFAENFMKTCSSCTSSICGTCAQSNHCPFCHSLFEAETQEHHTSDYSTKSANSLEAAFECNVCKEAVDQSALIVLINCKHEICRDCCRNNVNDQMLWTRTPKCPICMKCIAQNQLDEIGVSTSSQPETCSVCFGEFRQKFTLNKCGHVFCWECIKTSITIQQSNGTDPRCPMCRNSIEKAQIKILKAERSQSIPARNTNGQNRLTNEPILKYAVCSLCSGIYQKLIDLKNCGHAICRQCTKGAAPRCPLCLTFMDDAEIKL